MEPCCVLTFHPKKCPVQMICFISKCSEHTCKFLMDVNSLSAWQQKALHFLLSSLSSPGNSRMLRSSLFFIFGQSAKIVIRLSSFKSKAVRIEICVENWWCPIIKCGGLFLVINWLWILLMIICEFFFLLVLNMSPFKSLAESRLNDLTLVITNCFLVKYIAQMQTSVNPKS